jgi:hypothetical protein
VQRKLYILVRIVIIAKDSSTVSGGVCATDTLVLKRNILNIS